jgi:hypothetical protein
MRPWISGASFQDDFAGLPELLHLSHSIPPARTCSTARNLALTINSLPVRPEARLPHLPD